MSMLTPARPDFLRQCGYPPYRHHSGVRHPPPPPVFHHPTGFHAAPFRPEYGYQRSFRGAGCVPSRYSRSAVRTRQPASLVSSRRQQVSLVDSRQTCTAAAAVSDITSADECTPEVSASGTVVAAVASVSSSSPTAAVSQKSAMCQVNELARYHKVSHQYRLTGEEGPAHQRCFTVTLQLGEQEFTTRGSSIRSAQQAAAAAALLDTPLSRPPAKPRRSTSTSALMPTVELNTLAARRGECVTYTVVASGSHLSAQDPYVYKAPYLRSRCQVEVRVGERRYNGVGHNVQSARHAAADQALQQLRHLSPPRHACPISPENTDGGDDSLLKSPVSLVYEMARVRGLVVSFTIVDETGPAHLRQYVTRCEAGSVQASGEGTSKKLSKKNAAECIVAKLKELPVTVRSRTSGRAGTNKKTSANNKSHNLLKPTSSTDSGESESSGSAGRLSVDTVHPVSRLEHLQQARRLPAPSYHVIRELVVARRRHFVVSACVGAVSSTGEGPSKRTARRAAAAALLLKLGVDTLATQPNVKSALRGANHESQARANRRVTFQQNDGDESTSLVKDDTGSIADVNTCVSDTHHHSLSGEAALSNRENRTTTSSLVSLPLIDTSSGSLSVSSSDGNCPADDLAGSVSSVTASVGSITGSVNGQGNRQPIPGVLVINSCLPSDETGSSVRAESANLRGRSSPCGNNDASTTVSAHQRLLYLSKLLKFDIQCTDIPQVNGRSYLCLLSLTTTPPHVGHGCGASLEEARAHAAEQALASLSRLGVSENQLQILLSGSVRESAMGSQDRC